jgi:hypothetical protein
MNYLSRQVFLFAVDWADQVNKSFSFDLDEIQLGFGAEFTTRCSSTWCKAGT